MKKSGSYVALTLLLFYITVFATIRTSSVSTNPVSLQYTLHDPICLVGNDDEGWANFSGSGTVDDPKIIEGFEILGTNHCIWLINTTLHVVIRNCYLHTGIYSGVRLENASNVVVYNVTAFDLDIGVEAISCSNTMCNSSRMLSCYHSGILFFNCTSCTAIHCLVNETQAYHGIDLDSCTSCRVDSCTVINASYSCGIYLQWCSHCTVYRCVSLDNTYEGIHLVGCTDILVSCCNGTRNGDGVVLDGCTNCTVADSVFWISYARGAFLWSCSNCAIQGCDLLYALGIGVYISFTQHCFFSNNRIVGSDYGVFLERSTDCGFSSLDIYYSDVGVYCFRSSNHLFTNHNISYCDEGVRIEWSSNVTIVNSWVQHSSCNGTLIIDSSYCLLYNNAFSNNTVNCFLYNATGAVFNTTAYTPGPNIVGGPYLGGNYWSDYTGVDANRDGYGDTPYPLFDFFSGITLYDHLPLIPVFGDIIPPTVTILEPVNGSQLATSDVLLSWNATDDTGVESIRVELNGTTYRTLPGTVTNCTLQNLKLGWYNATVVAIDAAGNIGMDTVWFRVTADTSPPSIEIVQPEEGDLFNASTVKVEWTASDNVGIDHFEVRVDGEAWISVGADTSYTLTDLADGSHTVEVRVYDSSGNTDDDAVSFTVDTTPPTLTIQQPANNSVTNVTEITVQWTASDAVSGIAKYHIRLDNGSWTVVSSTSYTFSDLSYGKHTVCVKAVDRAGNAAVAHVCFTVVQPQPPTPPPLLPPPALIAIVAGVTAVLAIAFLLYRRRRTASESELIK